MFNRSLKSLLLFILLIFVIAGINFHSIIAALDHRYFVDEPDAYMHLVIAFDLLKHHDWYHHVNERLNAPFGADTHAWTQVVSAILLGGAFLISFVKPLATALYIWAFVLPILVNAIATCAMLWSVKPLKPTAYQQFFILAAFLLNPLIQSYFIPLRVDYDFLLLTVGIIYWGCFLRMLSINDQRWAVFSGVIAGLGVWTSISFVLLVLTSLTFIVVRAEHHLKAITKFLGVLCIVFCLIIPLEHRHFFTIAYDIISIVYLTFFLLLLVSLYVYERYSESLKSSKKIVFITILIFFIVLTMNYIFPGFYRGPYNQVDPYLLQHFFPVIAEFYSPFTIDNALGLTMLSYFILGAGYCYYRYLDNQCTDRIQSISIEFLLWAASCMTLLTVYMYRWNEFSAPVNILLVSFFVAGICRKKGNKLIKMGFVIVMVIIPAAILSFSKNEAPPAQKKCQQQFHNMIHDGFLDQKQFNNDKIILVESNYGPLMLYGTHFSVIATNDHHNPLGIKDSFNFFKEDEIVAKNIVLTRAIDLILICKAKTPTGFDIDSSQWVHRIALPKAYSYWDLYQIILP